MTGLKWIIENKIISLIIAALISGSGYGIKLLNDASYEKGYFKGCNETVKQSNQDLSRLIVLEHRCKFGLCPE